MTDGPVASQLRALRAIELIACLWAFITQEQGSWESRVFRKARQKNSDAVCLHNAELLNQTQLLFWLQNNHSKTNKQVRTIRFSTPRSSKNSCNMYRSTRATKPLFGQKTTLMASITRSRQEGKTSSR